MHQPGEGELDAKAGKPRSRFCVVFKERQYRQCKFKAPPHREREIDRLLTMDGMHPGGRSPGGGGWCVDRESNPGPAERKSYLL